MRRIGIVVFPGFQLISLAAASVFELANASEAEAPYEVLLLSDGGGLVRSSGGVRVETQSLEQPRLDTLLIVGGASRFEASTALLGFIKAAGSTARRVASTCTGAFLLAEAGLLDGKRAATHWFYAPELQRRYPQVQVDTDRIFITDGAVWTSAGMTAVVDLTLSMVEEDVGRQVSRSVACQLVVYHRRAGGQSQHSTLLDLRPEIRSRPARSGVRSSEPARKPVRGASRRRRRPQSPAVQPGVPDGDRQVARQGCGKPEGGSGAADD